MLKNLKNKDSKYWREKLTQKQYEVLRESKTETPFENEFYDKEEDGSYRCAGCSNLLFTSNQKYDSGCGWPSFYDLKEEGAVELRIDNSHNMKRVEVVCSNCNGHLGHLFNDGPKPTNKRYCINSASLTFSKEG